MRHWFHGIFASSKPMPQVSVIPENTRPPPTKAGSRRNAGWTAAPSAVPNTTSDPAARGPKKEPRCAHRRRRHRPRPHLRRIGPDRLQPANRSRSSHRPAGDGLSRVRHRSRHHDVQPPEPAARAGEGFAGDGVVRVNRYEAIPSDVRSREICSTIERDGGGGGGPGCRSTCSQMKLGSGPWSVSPAQSFHSVSASN